MQITKIQAGAGYTNYGKKDESKSSVVTGTVNAGKGFDFPKGYRPFFGARLERTPENFYEQDFNKRGMPKTMADYLNSNFAVNSKIPPAELTKKAFEGLEICKSIEDVKVMFPNEPLFQNLKTLEEVSPRGKGGYLYILKKFYERNNKNVLGTGEDLTVYLLKKIFLESKDIKEINDDFENDRMFGTDKDNQYCNEKYYFIPSTFEALGIEFPDKSYWRSLQANRADKERTSYTYTLKHPRKRPEHTQTEPKKPRERKPVVLSPEERQRRREVMVNRWIDMTPEQRQAQIDKMKEGQGNNILYQFASPIMYIATDKAHFQDKMHQYFRENREKLKADMPDDIVASVSRRQHLAMKSFWNDNPRLRKHFSYCIASTIKEFEEAKAKGDEALGELLNKAANIRDKNAERVLRRRLSNPEVIREELKDLFENQIFPFPDKYGDKYVNFVMNHERFKNEVIPLKAKMKLAKSEEEKDKHYASVLKVMSGVFNEFNRKNKKEGIAAIASLATVMMPFFETNAESAFKVRNNSLGKKMLDDSYEMLTGDPTCILSLVEKYEDFGSKKLVKNFKEGINKSMEIYSKDFTDEELKAASKNIMGYMEKIAKKWGNYKTLNNPEIRRRCADKISKAYKNIEKNKDVRRNFMNFVNDYSGLLKFSQNLISGAFKSGNRAIFVNLDSAVRYYTVRDYLYESIIDDYLKEN